MRPIGLAAAVLAGTLLVPAGASATPSNDRRTSALLISRIPFRDARDITGARAEPGEPHPCGFPLQGSVWYRLRLPNRARVGVDTQGSSFQAYIAVYEGSSRQELTCDAGNERLAMIAFEAARGRTYWIQIGTLEDGRSRLSLRVREQAAPRNDAFARATPISALPAALEGDTTGSTDEVGEPIPRECIADDLLGNTVWFRVRLQTPAPVVATTRGSGFVPVLTVYEGNDLAHLELIQCDWLSASGGESVGFTVLPGRTYYVQIGGARSVLGVPHFGRLRVRFSTGVHPGVRPEEQWILEGTVLADQGMIRAEAWLLTNVDLFSVGGIGYTALSELGDPVPEDVRETMIDAYLTLFFALVERLEELPALPVLWIGGRAVIEPGRGISEARACAVTHIPDRVGRCTDD